MKLFFKNNIKIFEVLGLIFALGAWSLDWWSVQKWLHANTSYHDTITNIYRTFSHSDLVVNIKFESAVTRCIQDDFSITSNPGRNYAFAWKSPEVRALWMLKTSNELDLFEDLISHIESTYDKYKKKHPTNLLKVSTLPKTIRMQLYMFSSQIPGNDMLRLPKEDLDINDVEKNLEYIHLAIVNEINPVGSFLKDQSKTISWIYRIIFIFGSMLLILSKILEWRIGLDIDSIQTRNKRIKTDIQS